MPATNLTSTASVLGDFVFGWGPGLAAWMSGLSGFQRVGNGQGNNDDEWQAAVAGSARHGTAADGSRWLAVADLIEGRVEEGVRAIETGAPVQRAWRGRFAQLVWQPASRRGAVLTDHLSTVSVYTLAHDDVFLCATDLRLLAASPWCARALDLESVYHYLNFAQIPAPRTIFQDIRRLEPATRARFKPGTPSPSLDRYAVPEYREDLRGPDDKLAGELREQIIATVQAYRPDGDEGWGCFLSGGTDSSSIVSILARQTGRGRVKSFSIGFSEQGFDELGFAETAAAACGADASFARVSREETQALVGRVIESYDQPFGNASAIPTMACADLAAGRGVHLLVAGDGGDEIFGGNERYAKDKVMEAWFALPTPVKTVARAIGGAVGEAVGGGSNLLLNRVENFFERSSIPNPDRFYTDDSFASDHYHQLLRPEFRAAVGREASLEFMRAVYALGDSGGPLHRIMRLDLLMAIAQNDVRKVSGATASAGVSVRFPYLDPMLIEYTGRLPTRHKVRGLDKRYLFKRAMKGILPDKIIRKKKQGFGLPISVWLRSDPAFQASVRETLFDPGARSRHWWNQPFIERLLAEHERGAWDHADSIWRLFVMERWLQRYAA